MPAAHIEPQIVPPEQETISSGSIPASSNARRTPISETQAPAPPPAIIATRSPSKRRSGRGSERREDVGAHRRAPVHARKREQRAPGAHHEGRVERRLDQLDALTCPAEAEEHVVEVEVCATSHTATLSDSAGPPSVRPRGIARTTDAPGDARAGAVVGHADLAATDLREAAGSRELDGAAVSPATPSTLRPQRTVKSACWPAL